MEANVANMCLFTTCKILWLFVFVGAFFSHAAMSSDLNNYFL